MKRYGLIGYPLEHSFSKTYFEHKFKTQNIAASYDLFPLKDRKSLAHFLANTQLDAFNVTIPWKEEVAASCDVLDETAKAIAAVNCVVKTKDQQWKGYNTDCIGFETSLLAFTSLHHKQAFVFGTGGSAKAVCYVLEKHRVPYLKVSRANIENGITYQDLTEGIVDSHRLWINTTPVGMYPKVEEHLPLPFYLLNENFEVFDVIYNPEKTKLLEFAALRGARICNGYDMLLHQAEAAYALFQDGV